jgi:2',3'-cyclic-nucleotide 2'-phosphodiesterase/3'-nucleotidase
VIRRHPFHAGATGRQAHLRIVETTDLHVHVQPYDYYADRPTDRYGLARTATLIEAARAEAANTLVVDNGDFLQGNPMGDYIAFERGLKGGDLHPVIRAMNTLGFDAATLGNHDFNYGLGFLENCLAGAEFPVVSANVVKSRGAAPRADRALFRPYVILERDLIDGAGRRQPIRIGVIGFVPPQIVTWDYRHLQGRAKTRDIVETAEAWVPEMKEAGADIILALCHSGIGPAAHVAGMENAAVPLGRVAGIDALLTGHSHLLFPAPGFTGFAGVDPVAGTISGKPAVMAGFWGGHIGLIDLLLERDAGTWQVRAHHCAVRPLAPPPDAPPPDTASPDAASEGAGAARVIDGVAKDHAGTLRYIRRAVGRAPQPLHSYFALVADNPSVRIVAEAQGRYVARHLAGSDLAGLPVLSAAAAFKTGGRGGPDNYTDVAAGALSLGNVADLYLFPNTICAVRVTGAQLRDWLDRAAGVFQRIAAGARDAPLLNPDFPGYNFDVIHGLTYEIDPGQPARFDEGGALIRPDASRIRNLRHMGAPVAPDQEFIVAANNYRAAGGGGFPGALGDTLVFEGPDTIREVLVRSLADPDFPGPQAPPTWRFSPMPGTTALFDTSPKAGAHLPRLTAICPGLRVEHAGAGPGGFARFRIHL